MSEEFTVEDYLDDECRICGASIENPNGRIIPRMEGEDGVPSLDGTWICGDHLDTPGREADEQ